MWPRIVETEYMRAEILLQQQVLAAEAALTLHHDEPTGAGCFSLGYVVTYVRQLDDWKGLDEITIETPSPPVLASIPGGRGVRLDPQERTPPALAVAYVKATRNRWSLRTTRHHPAAEVHGRWYHGLSTYLKFCIMASSRNRWSPRATRHQPVRRWSVVGATACQRNGSV